MSDTPAPQLKRRRWLTFRLRTFFVLLTLFGVWLGFHVRAARRQEASLAAIRDIGGWCYHDFQHLTPQRNRDYAATSPLPEWLINLLGVDFFHDVVEVNLVYAYDAEGRHDNSRGTGNDLKHLLGFPRLQVLALHEGQVSNAGLEYVGRLTELEELFIWNGTEVTDAGVEHLRPLRKLRYLHLSNSKISDDAFKTLAQMPSLTGLSLQYNHFTNAGLQYLRDDTKLEQLIIGLGELEIDDQGLAHLQKLVNLRRLDIANSRVEGPGLRFLDELRQLKDLWASGTRIQPAYFHEFQRVHPNCKIEK